MARQNLCWLAKIACGRIFQLQRQPRARLFVCMVKEGGGGGWTGVPQGTALGPMLFLLYINDIADNVDSQMRLFADDSIVYREICSPEDHEPWNKT